MRSLCAAPTFDRTRFSVTVSSMVGSIELGVHRNKIIDVGHLDAVAGVVDHGPVGLGRFVAEVLQHLLQRGAGRDIGLATQDDPPVKA
jgi:hypothetical protein